MPRRSSHASPTPPAPRAPTGPGLRYVNDGELPGIRRERHGEGFRYRRPDGRLIRDEAELARIRRLAIPPAYAEVWICPYADGHLQATGRDARGRKQYRYHPQWNAQRTADKFARLVAFGHALPRLRRRIEDDLSGDPASLSRARILATLVRLLDTTYLRVGNAEYARQNRSYGLTTLRNDHVRVRTDEVRLSFRGKHGIMHSARLQDRRIARVIRRCQQLPGQALFQYEEAGEVHGIGSGDVNDYLSEAAGERFTAKDFRTWHGTVEALELTRQACAAAAEGQPFDAKGIVAAVARRLGNTVAVCRKAYIHPDVLALGERLAGEGLPPALARRLTRPLAPRHGLGAAERRLLDFLENTRKDLGCDKRSPLHRERHRQAAA